MKSSLPLDFCTSFRPSLSGFASTAVLKHGQPETIPSTGRGSYGSVYKAQAKDTGEVVAVKVIPLGDKDEVAEIQKEIAMLKECNHPNVVQYLVRLPTFVAHAYIKHHAAHAAETQSQLSLLYQQQH